MSGLERPDQVSRLAKRFLKVRDTNKTIEKCSERRAGQISTVKLKMLQHQKVRASGADFSGTQEEEANGSSCSPPYPSLDHRHVGPDRIVDERPILFISSDGGLALLLAERAEHFPIDLLIPRLIRIK